jgi:predicted nucleic acid-binding protein
VKAFLDTTVLVATFYGDHEHHDRSIGLFLRFAKRDACCAAHSLAEVYSVLTGMPGKHRVSGDEALLFLGNVRERLTLLALSQEEYFATIEAASAAGLAGGSICDAILGQCALKSGAGSIYTWNLKDFQRLGPEIARRARTP